MEFMVTVRGRWAKGRLVSKTSFIQASQISVSCLMVLAFELPRQNILHGRGERGSWGIGWVAILCYHSGKILQS